MPTKLSININKIATLRNTRALEIPSLAHLGRIALRAGAHGLTIHPRPDQRHIRAGDIAPLADLWRQFPGTEFNIEGNPFYDYLPHIHAVRPTQCTLVPDAPDAFTSNHGWSLTADIVARLRPLIAEMKSLGCRVSLFMDADSTEFAAARDLGADRIELYTEPYAAAFAQGDPARTLALDLFADAAARAAHAGLAVNAGHDLNLHNLPSLVGRIPALAEVSIGHALIADALEFGLSDTIHRYLEACGEKPNA